MSDRPERVFISVDMEGISGIVDWAQVGGNSKEYEVGRRLMAGDLNAAIEGALEAGAEEIVVSDAHGRKRNLQPEEVHEAAYLIRGSPKPGSMMEGISDRFDAALYVGYHSMKGTENGILCHTISGGAVDAVFINGRETGEFGRYAAKCLNPKRARALIKRAVTEALANTDSIEPFKVEEPVEVRLRYVTSAMADLVAILPYVERVDGRTVKAVFKDYSEALGGLRAAIYLATVAENR